jgi:hypothetical protein
MMPTTMARSESPKSPMPRFNNCMSLEQATHQANG